MVKNILIVLTLFLFTGCIPIGNHKFNPTLTILKHITKGK